MYPLGKDMSEIYAHPLPRVYAIFLFASEYSAKAQQQQQQHQQQQGRAWQSGKLHILLAEDGHVF